MSVADMAGGGRRPPPQPRPPAVPWTPTAPLPEPGADQAEEDRGDRDTDRALVDHRPRRGGGGRARAPPPVADPGALGAARPAGPQGPEGQVPEQRARLRLV